MNTGFDVNERRTKLITTDILDASDEDSNEEFLNFEITKTPAKGTIYFDDIPLEKGLFRE